MSHRTPRFLHFSPSRFFRLGVLGAGVLFTAVGCAQNCDLVEAELRTREREVYELREELHRAECYTRALQQEFQTLQHAPPPPPPAPSGGSGKSGPSGTSGKSALLHEQVAPVSRLKQVKLGRGTGGYDDDGCPGDEALQVILEPFDCDDHTIKAPGALHVEALEITPEGFKKPLSAWDVPPDKLRKLWKSGLMGSGYHVVLPWKVPPTTCKLRVVAQFLLADGRAFEADKDVTIRLPPQPPAGLGTPTEDVPPPSPREQDPVLPPPRPFDSGPLFPGGQARAVPQPGGPVGYTAAKPSDWQPLRLDDAVQMLPPVPGGRR